MEVVVDILFGENLNEFIARVVWLSIGLVIGRFLRNRWFKKNFKTGLDCSKPLTK